eukprot:gene4314-33733_t
MPMSKPHPWGQLHELCAAVLRPALQLLLRRAHREGEPQAEWGRKRL